MILEGEGRRIREHSGDITFELEEMGEVCSKGKVTPVVITRWLGVQCMCERLESVV